MGQETLFDKFKSVVVAISFKVMLWGLSMTDSQYWDAIYQQEKSMKIKCCECGEECYDHPSKQCDFCNPPF